MQQDLGMEQVGKVLEFIDHREVWGAVSDFTRLRGSFIKVLDVLRNAYYPVVGEKSHNYKPIVVSEDIITDHVANKLRDFS